MISPYLIIFTFRKMSEEICKLHKFNTKCWSRSSLYSATNFAAAASILSQSSGSSSYKKKENRCFRRLSLIHWTHKLNNYSKKILNSRFSGHWECRLFWSSTIQWIKAQSLLTMSYLHIIISSLYLLFLYKH